jgi:hypothetical protein
MPGKKRIMVAGVLAALLVAGLATSPENAGTAPSLVERGIGSPLADATPAARSGPCPKGRPCGSKPAPSGHSRWDLMSST